VSCRKIISISIVMAVLAAGVVVQTAPRRQEVRDPRVDAIMNAVINPLGPGASVIVIHDGQILHEAGYGLANLESRRVNTPQTLYHMASTGKQFTALAIMMMKERGQLTYDDPIAIHLPELSRFGSKVTLRQLMQHTSGVPDYYASTTGYNLLLAIDPTPNNDQALELLRTWGALSPDFAGRWVYNNTGYDLLGTVIQHKNAQSLDAYMRQHIFGPLGMTESFSLPNPLRFADPNRARGYVPKGTGWLVDDSDPLDDLVGAKSIYTSVHELFAYDQALYTNQLVLQTTLQEAFVGSKLTDGKIQQYGFGWYLGTRNGHSYTGHGGDYEGYRSYILRFPSDHFSVYLLGNNHALSPDVLAFSIFDVFEPIL
jgi:CubicO group peptidase (beta-lactamase class C family)